MRVILARGRFFWLPRAAGARRTKRNVETHFVVCESRGHSLQKRTPRPAKNVLLNSVLCLHLAVLHDRPRPVVAVEHAAQLPAVDFLLRCAGPKRKGLRGTRAAGVRPSPAQTERAEGCFAPSSPSPRRLLHRADRRGRGRVKNRPGGGEEDTTSVKNKIHAARGQRGADSAERWDFPRGREGRGQPGTGSPGRSRLRLAAGKRATGCPRVHVLKRRTNTVSVLCLQKIKINIADAAVVRMVCIRPQQQALALNFQGKPAVCKGECLLGLAGKTQAEESARTLRAVKTHFVRPAAPPSLID